jgi:raffinose/stachyose/melibiose transport system permease protein
MSVFKRILLRVGASLFAIIWIVVSFLPFYLMVATSLKSRSDYGTNGFFTFPKEFMFSNYREVIEDGIFSFFKNSLIVNAASLAALVALGLCAAYPFARMKFRLNKPLHSFVVACMAIPLHVTLIPIYLLTRSMGLYDTIYALIGPYIAFNLPITIFILTSFMRETPRELEDAAQIDGCSKYGIFAKVMVPLSRAGIVTVAIYDAITMWNEFSFALVLTQTERNRTLPLALWNYRGQYSSNVPLLFCVLFLSAVPMIVAFAVGQDKLIKGMIAGAIKG